MMRKIQNGLTLIELMISLALSLLVVVGLTEVYLSTRQTNRMQDMQERLTEDGRYALSMMQRMVTQAGYHAPNAAMADDRISPDSTSPSTSFTLKTIGDGTNLINCSGAAIADGTTDTSTIAFDATNKKLTCTSGASTVNWITPQTGGRGTEVISVAFSYGVDTGFSPTTLDTSYRCGSQTRDCIADSYVNALTGGVTAVQIVALKLCMVLRTEFVDQGVSKAAAVKDCAGNDISNSQNDHKLYRQFQSTILLKNR